MDTQDFHFEPGLVLHGAIVGAFKASGVSFEHWLTEQGVNMSSARNATYGQSNGPKGRALLARLIAAAGPEVVRAGYIARMDRHMAEIKAGAAA